MTLDDLIQELWEDAHDSEESKEDRQKAMRVDIQFFVESLLREIFKDE